MIKLIEINRQSVAFCKYTIAGLLWLSLILGNMIPIYIVFAIMLISAFTGVHRSPLVLLFDMTVCPYIKPRREYINMYSMRFAHFVGCVFCVLSGLSYYLLPHFVFVVILIIFALLQSIASFGYCSAAKLYECVICNSNCCRFGKKIRSMKKDA